MSDAAPLITTGGRQAPSALKTLVSVGLRYSFSALGPIGIAAAHFIAALVFLRYLHRADFGLFSFVFIVVPFALSLTGAMFGAALVNSANAAAPMTQNELAAYMKANVLFAVASGVAVFALMRLASAGPKLSAVIAIYGALMTARWFARCHAFAVHNMTRAILSDFAYSGVMFAGLGAASIAGVVTPIEAALLLTASALVAFLAFGRAFLAAQARALIHGKLRDFLPIWQDLARWSVLGVVATEFTANAHAYLVTFFAGPKAFALLAVGSLFMRPVTLILTALPDAERPRLARALVAGKIESVTRTIFQFRIAALGVLAGTAILAAIIMIWFPHMILKRGYPEESVLAVISVWTVVMAVRALRTPESVMLQAAREFRPLAGASLRSAAVSLIATCALLIAFGPLVSLLGVLAGDLVMAERIFALGRKWRAAHG